MVPLIEEGKFQRPLRSIPVWEAQIFERPTNFKSDANRVAKAEAPEPPMTPQTDVNGTRDVTGDLEWLRQLKVSGGLTEAEYEVMKAQTLSRASTA